MHGHEFFVTGVGYRTETTMSVENVKKMLENAPEKYYLTSRKFLIKDTVPVPPNGFAVIRMKATNPGFWFFHCHFGKKNF